MDSMDRSSTLNSCSVSEKSVIEVSHGGSKSGLDFLDGMMILLAMISINFLHPGRLLP